MNGQPSVNGVAIAEAAIAAEMQNHPAASAEAARSEAERARISEVKGSIQ